MSTNNGPQSPECVYISSGVIAGFHHELKLRPGVETGGCLGSLRSHDGACVMLTGNGPGPQATHGGSHLFLHPDSIEYGLNHCERLLGAGCEITTWHSHPEGVPAVPSGGDRRSAQRALAETGQPQLIMTILARGTPHTLGVWVINQAGEAHPLPVEIFGESDQAVRLLHPRVQPLPAQVWYAETACTQALTALQQAMWRNGFEVSFRVSLQEETLTLVWGDDALPIPKGFPKTPPLDPALWGEHPADWANALITALRPHAFQPPQTGEHPCLHDITTQTNLTAAFSKQ
jgi:hypothetical protein